MENEHVKELYKFEKLSNLCQISKNQYLQRFKFFNNRALKLKLRGAKPYSYLAKLLQNLKDKKDQQLQSKFFVDLLNSKPPRNHFIYAKNGNLLPFQLSYMIKKQKLRCFNHLKLFFDHNRRFVYPQDSSKVEKPPKTRSILKKKKSASNNDDMSIVSFDVSLFVPKDNLSTNSDKIKVLDIASDPNLENKSLQKIHLLRKGTVTSITEVHPSELHEKNILGSELFNFIQFKLNQDRLKHFSDFFSRLRSIKEEFRHSKYRKNVLEYERSTLNSHSLLSSNGQFSKKRAIVRGFAAISDVVDNRVGLDFKTLAWKRIYELSKHFEDENEAESEDMGKVEK